MSTCVNLRLFNKKGLRTTHTIPVDVSAMPSGSLDGFALYWNCRRTVNEVSASIAVNSSDNPSQLYVIDPTEASVGLVISENDSINLYAGTYYWQLDLLQVSGSVRLSYPAVGYGDIIFQPGMSSYVPSSVDPTPSPSGYIEADTSGGDYIANLPTAFSFIGRLFIVKADALIGGDVIITPDGSETIDGFSTYTISSPNASVMLYSDGLNWKVVAS